MFVGQQVEIFLNLVNGEDRNVILILKPPKESKKNFILLGQNKKRFPWSEMIHFFKKKKLHKKSTKTTWLTHKKKKTIHLATKKCWIIFVLLDLQQCDDPVHQTSNSDLLS